MEPDLPITNSSSPPTEGSRRYPGYAERCQRIEQGALPPSINSLLDQSAERYGPELLCTFIANGSSLTYREFRERSLAVAAALRSQGIGKGDHVAAMLPNIMEFPLVWTALARLGAVMVPINTRFTSDELSYALTDAEAAHIIIHIDHLAILEGCPAGRPPRERVLVVGGNDPRGVSFDLLVSAMDPSDQTWPEVALDDLVGIQYTSGTTGFPKGCLITHRSWLVAAAVLVETMPATPRRILSDTPFFYLDPQFELLMAMWGGGSVVLAPRPSLTRFMDWVRTYDIDYCGFWEALPSQPEQPYDADHVLRHVTLSGLPKDQHAYLEHRFGVTAREMYGMTEIGLCLLVPWEADDMVGSGSCGIPVPFREVKLTDPEHPDHEVGPGQVGELCVRGPGVFLGYHAKPEANEAAFLDGGWFRTGDLFKRDDAGFYYIVGRVKDMIRRSGENIAAREVESVLEQMQQISEAAVVAVPDQLRVEEVKAYVVLRTGEDRDGVPPEQIFEHCRRHLASFKVPRYLEYRPALPRTQSNKIAKAALRDEKEDLRTDSYDRVDKVWR